MQDHVDFVVGQWSRAMPELDASSMKIFGRMLRLMKHLGKVDQSLNLTDDNA